MTTTLEIPAIGTTRSFAGVTFTATEELKTFDGKPRGVRWRAGRGVSVDEQCLSPGDHPFAGSGIHCRTFEAAAKRAIASRIREVRRAAELVDAHNAEPQAYREALENAAASS